MKLKERNKMLSNVEMLKEILKSSGWTQEQLAARLGVSFATVNGWLNGKTEPREATAKNIQKLYLAQDVTNEVRPVYVTLMHVPRDLEVGSNVLLMKDKYNDYDDEAIRVEEDCDYSERFDEKHEEDEGNRPDDDECQSGKWAEDVLCEDPMYVANSVNTVMRGTYSAGRIYDKFDGTARAQVMFVGRGIAIARVIDWNAQAKMVHNI